MANIRYLRYCGIFAALLLGGSVRLVADTIIVSVVPGTQSAAVGDQVDVAVSISGLGNGAAPSLRGYDLEIGYDPTVLANTGVTFGDPALGDQLALPCGTSPCSLTLTHSGAGSLEDVEVSLDSIKALDSLQAGAFTLFTVDFKAVGMGSSAITLSNVTLANSFGGRLFAEITGGEVDVNSTGKTSDVPEPGSLWLLATGLVSWLALRRCRSKSGLI